ncbi:hypothetical protein K440DRAFT_318081 [Wilcoxina mikolae CBS 423.85]|nr:hypothetical protein K440DRAFT_318081 [Wilcoxina mikolae CBS 423.85]
MHQSRNQDSILIPPHELKIPLPTTPQIFPHYHYHYPPSVLPSSSSTPQPHHSYTSTHNKTTHTSPIFPPPPPYQPPFSPISGSLTKTLNPIGNGFPDLNALG